MLGGPIPGCGIGTELSEQMLGVNAPGWLQGGVPVLGGPCPDSGVTSLFSISRNQCSCHFQGMDYPPGDSDIPTLGHW